MSLNIAAVVPLHTDATSWYRGCGPLASLRKHNKNISIQYLSQYNWAYVKHCDVFFMQRPFKDEHVQIFKMIKDNNRKVWLDYDDDLFSVGTDNPTAKTYNRSDIQRNVEYMLKNADRVSVSTSHLKQCYSKYNDKIKVINNALDDDLLIHRNKKPRNNLVMWRGSPTHHRDVLSVAAAIESTSQLKKDWVFEFIGDNLWFLTDKMPHERTIVSDGLDIIDYHRHGVNVAPSIMMVPLENNLFNRSKSNIAWIEASFFGAATLCPGMSEMHEWQVPGAVGYLDQNDFFEKLNAMMAADPRMNESLAQKSFEYICDKLLLSKVNHERMEIVESLA